MIWILIIVLYLFLCYKYVNSKNENTGIFSKIMYYGLLLPYYLVVIIVLFFYFLFTGKGPDSIG